MVESPSMRKFAEVSFSGDPATNQIVDPDRPKFPRCPRSNRKPENHKSASFAGLRGSHSRISVRVN